MYTYSELTIPQGGTRFTRWLAAQRAGQFDSWPRTSGYLSVSEPEDESAFDLSVDDIKQLYNFKPRRSLMDRIAATFGLQSRAVR